MVKAKLGLHIVTGNLLTKHMYGPCYRVLKNEGEKNMLEKKYGGEISTEDSNSSTSTVEERVLCSY